ncbi:MAG: acyl-CoA dehydrogenase C-terminal domain-containing protein, partial [Candidatus Eremiobacteraeota bacterium]|nr:acyl-CoA dehydrogenase C-terminal domain-containing protein [Candidatus Eremiobacteraeota bacterium]
KAIGAALKEAVEGLAEVSQWIGMNAMGDLRKAFACSVPYLKLWGIVAGGWQMARAAEVSRAKIDAGDPESDFYRAKISTARFYADHVLTQSSALRSQIVDGSADVMAMPEAHFDLDRKTATLV